MATAAPATPTVRPRSVGEDTDVIVALIRTAFIVAFYVMRYVARAGHVPLYMDVVLTVAALFNLSLFALYLQRRPLQAERPFALILDLVVVTAATVAFADAFGEEAGRDLFDLYYLVVIAAAIWFRRIGAVITAAVAIIFAILARYWLQNDPYAIYSILSSAKAPLLLLIAVIAGYLVRARDAEHQAVVEMRQEMRLARVLQSAMLPRQLPEVPGYEVGALFEPARSVGGDFYDLRLLNDDHLLIVMADMAGKSVYGLVHLSLVHSHLEAAASEGLWPGEIADLVNRGTYAALQPESYAALFIAVLRLSDGLLRFVNAGHVPPLLLHTDRTRPPERLSTGGIVVGAMLHPNYNERAVRLEPGDLLVCYSDGISEAMDKRRELFGEERVAEISREAASGTAQEVVQAVHRRVADYSATPGQDDITLLVIGRRVAEQSLSPGPGPEE